MPNNVKKSSRLPWIITACGLGLALPVVVPLVRERLHSGQAPVVQPSGRSDASEVLDPMRFRDPAPQRAYVIARQIPATLNQLYCWCGCKEHSGHRALLECFETEHASQCDICMGEAVIASDMVRGGVTDVRKIQDAIDASFAPGRRRT